jgi:hypothetical protein
VVAALDARSEGSGGARPWRGRVGYRIGGHGLTEGAVQQVGHRDLSPDARAHGAVGGADRGAHGVGNLLADRAALHALGRDAEVRAAVDGLQHDVERDGVGRLQQPGPAVGAGPRADQPALPSMAVTRRTTTGLVGTEAASSALATARSAEKASLCAK